MKSLRDDMPLTAEFIDAMRDAFGAEAINEQIRNGMRGALTFWAQENGHEIGSRSIVRTADVVGANKAERYSAATRGNHD